MLRQFYSFDRHYLERLRRGDVSTGEHFADYFGRFARLAPGDRSDSRSAIEDIRQETFLRVWSTLRKNNGIRQPERFGAFVTSVAKNVRREHQRKTYREDQAGDDSTPNLRDRAIGAADVLEGHELQRQVVRILAELPAKSREVLRRVFLEECDKDEVCRALGINRQYLRVLVHRATRQFRKIYLDETHPKARRRPAKHLAAVSSQLSRSHTLDISHSSIPAGCSPHRPIVGRMEFPHQIGRTGLDTSSQLTTYAGGFK